MFKDRPILSVKDLNQMVKNLLDDAVGQIWLVGEISNLSKPSSGHWYFTLKDDSAQVRCAMFRNQNFKVGFAPQNGQQVLVKATVTLYEARGEYQLVLDSMQDAGAGLLQQKFDLLKNKLYEEGLFDPSHKRTLPENIRKVGIITSPTGAALHDICQILNRRDPSLQLIIYPTQVQGNEAAAQIIRMIELANQRAECDVLIIGRGGGSIEDLWSFNNENLARAIYKSQLTIVSAVGHEIDFTIADFVADIRAATPSAAAELVSHNKLERLKNIKIQEQHLSIAMDYYLMSRREKLSTLYHQLDMLHPKTKLANKRHRLLHCYHVLQKNIQQYLLKKINQHKILDKKLSNLSPQNQIIYSLRLLDNSQQKIITVMQKKLIDAKHNVAIASSKLNSVSPLATLDRGYSITLNDQNNVIRQVEEVSVGDTITTKLKQGKFTSKITKVEQ